MRKTLLLVFGIMMFLGAYIVKTSLSYDILKSTTATPESTNSTQTQQNDHRKAFFDKQTWITDNQLEAIRKAQTPSDAMELVVDYMTSKRPGMAAHETIFEGCLSYLKPKISDKMEAINWIFEQQSKQSPFEKVDVKTFIGQQMSDYQEDIEDAWELEGYKFCRDILENRQPKSLYQFFDWMDPVGIQTTAELYQEGNYVLLVNYFGRMIADLILLEDFDVLKNVSRRVSDLCEYGIKSTIGAENFQIFKKAMDLKYINAAYEFVEDEVNTKNESHKTELNAAFRMCQKLREISPNTPRNKYHEAFISMEFHFSKCAAQLKERKNLTMKNYRNHEEYLKVVLDFYKTSNITDTIGCAQENLEICEKLLIETLTRTGFTLYRENQFAWTNCFTKKGCGKEWGKPLIGKCFERTYSSTLQTLEAVCQYSRDIICKKNYGTALQKNIRWQKKPVFDFEFWKPLEKLERSRISFQWGRLWGALRDEPREIL